MGAQPIWNPHQWPQIAERHALRAVTPGEQECCDRVDATGTGQGEPRALVSARGLAARPSPSPVAFSGRAGCARWESSWLLRGAGREARGYTRCIPGGLADCREEKAIRSSSWQSSPAAPNGTSELLIDAVMRQSAQANKSYVTLGPGRRAWLVPPCRKIQQKSRWMRTIMRFARAHANRFYNFRGLEHFRVKMAPDAWEPVFAISNESHFSVFALYDMSAAFSGIPPWLAIGICFC